MCLNNIISIPEPCSTVSPNSLTGLSVYDIAGINPITANQIASPQSINGYEELKRINKIAYNRINSDIQKFLASEFRLNSIGEVWTSGKYTNPYTTIPASIAGSFRGVVIYKQNKSCYFVKPLISVVRLLANVTGTYTLKLSDFIGSVATVTNYSVELEAGVIKEYQLDYTMQGHEVQIQLPSDVSVYSNKPYCGTGCSGTPVSKCVKVLGINQGQSNTSEAYGIEVDVLCKCDFSMILCDLANDKLLGNAYLNLYASIFYEQVGMSNNLNYLTIHKAKEAKELSIEYNVKYIDDMNVLIKALRNYVLNNDRGCGCATCIGLTKMVVI